MMFDMLAGISAPALLASFGWSKIFKKLEPKPDSEEEAEVSDEDSIVKEAEKEMMLTGAAQTTDKDN